MWEILEHRRAARQLDKLPPRILKRYEKWKDVVRMSGPFGLRAIRGFRDESLSGIWNGHRSSRLNEQYRIIYRIVRDQVIVEVVDINAHDYRRK
ncbi:type II toxin-antitoxin system mRNA interferase toxin, RelE/StbE family [Wenzhouxiangella sp. XN24]|uniref:type II toxin-antitoxin system RelE/ParE family toxin n=1 Tax=Wenzhouxiangella sp. XN24 TaxID=2713569 RepID=UPI0013EB77A9|nr:type II toxin-antitoxin system mRNA interferase toxin, RelE/StbE family [Wenzhouxiangella sp. XN24]NGX17008.1 type II toxin-antitoxin system mRNA interferase toxin, RelE/StbE family [Wenzhouxiangella sp. XN24]